MLTLIFAIASLYLFVLALLYLSFQHTRSLRLVKSRYLQDLGRVEVRVGLSPHDCDAFAYHFVDGSASVS